MKRKILGVIVLLCLTMLVVVSATRIGFEDEKMSISSPIEANGTGSFDGIILNEQIILEDCNCLYKGKMVFNKTDSEYDKLLFCDGESDWKIIAVI